MVPIATATLRIGILLLLSASVTPVLAKEETRKLLVGGVERSYILFTPAQTGSPRPTILLLHGGGLNATSGLRTTGIQPLIEREGLIAVYPNAHRREWNDGRGARLTARGYASDDVAFVRALVNSLVAEGITDPKRIYITGQSNGGMMTLRLLCESAELFAAAAPVIANLPVDIADNCRPARPVPVLIMNGTADPLMPYHGGGVGFAGRRGEVLSTDETIARLRRINGCAATKTTERLPDIVPDDGSTVTIESWTVCTSNSPIVLYRVDGGGHRIPHRGGIARPLIDRMLGKENHDFDAAEAIWAFFRDKKR